MPIRFVLAALFALGLLPVSARTASAQADYPNRPITIVVPFPPGGVADQAARPVASAMEKILHVAVVVSNKPAAAGAVGMSSVANAKPDGYTLLMALSSISIIPEADKLFGRPPAYRTDQLVPVALFTADPTVLVVPADSPWKTLQDFVEDAKKRPNMIAYSSSGIYGTLHLAMAMFAHAAGIELRHVPFTGGGPALTALLGGNVQALASGPGPVLPQIRAGKLRALATWGDRRLAALPDVPTFKELGYKDVEFYIWAGLFAPAGTPEPILTKLRETSAKVVDDPEFKSAMDKLQTPVAYKDAPEFKRFWDEDAARLQEAVRRIGRVEEKK
jgi:tripartite-type tricarboxylate transporter receptor subunit TctC